MKKVNHKCPNCDAFTENTHDYRQQVIKEVSAFGRTTYLHLSKRLLLKRMRNLTSEDKSAVEIMQQVSQRLKEAYLLKEKFLEFVDIKDLFETKKNLLAWYLYVDVSNVPEFDECSKTIKNWEKYILNSFTCPYTNGFTEGCNYKIKV